jgi:anti-sigma regulatory factor (Ser/Thr protein kinase)
VHLLSELLDNATAFSPPSTQVTVAFMKTPKYPGSVVVLVRDHGVGMSPDRFAELNQRITAPEAIDGTMVRSMGLIVVGRLAARHGIGVRLGPTEGGGVTATVVLPQKILVGDEQPGPTYPRMPKAVPANPRRVPNQDNNQYRQAAPLPPQPPAPQPPPPTQARVVPPHLASGYPAQDSLPSTSEIAPLVPGKALTQQDAMAMRREFRRRRADSGEN